MSAHTPGPWRYYTEPQPNGCPIVGNGRGLMVCMCAHSVHETDQRDEALANAALIAAAPDLLSELKACEAVLTSMHQRFGFAAGSLELLEGVRATIAKAEGAS